MKTYTDEQIAEVRDALKQTIYQKLTKKKCDDCVRDALALLDNPVVQENKYGWLVAADEELVIAHLGVAELSHGYEYAKTKLRELIDWHVAVATDPSVNGGFGLQPVSSVVQEPVAWRKLNNDGKTYALFHQNRGWKDTTGFEPLYTAPQEKK